MSARWQGFAAGIIFGTGLFLTQKFDVQSQYDVVMRDIQRFHININPKFIPDQPIIQQRTITPKKKPWLVQQPPDVSQQSLGKRPADTWNRWVVVWYRGLLQQIYAIPNQQQPQQQISLQ